MNNGTTSIRPIGPGERIQSLEILCGFAILGILIMKIQSYGIFIEDFSS